MSEFKDMKFRVENEEHSKQIQEALFKLGYKWRIGGQYVGDTSEPYLFTYDTGRIYYGIYESVFQDCQHTEYKLINGEIIKSTEEKEVETIKLTYTEAWEALKEGKKVFYLGRNLELKDDLIVEGSHIFAFHNTARPFTMKKEPEYEVLGLHDDWVEIEVFGLKAYQELNTSLVYFIGKDGHVYSAGGSQLGRVKYEGDYTKSMVKVITDSRNLTIYAPYL